MTDVEKVMKLTGETDVELVKLQLEEAQVFVLDYTNRTQMIPKLEKVVRDLVVIALNRMGTEGESARSEGGESYTFDKAPKHIYDTLNRYRLARVGGKVYETAAQQSETVSS